MRYWGKVFHLAWAEARQEVRWDTLVRVVQNVGGPVFSGVVVWVITKQFAWSAVATLGVAALLAFALFAQRVFAIPSRLAQESSARSRRSESALRDQIAELEDQVRALHGELDAFRNPPPPARNPNAIYQHGQSVGSVQGAIADLAHSSVQFAEIKAGGEFDRTREFEYQDLVLKLVKADAIVDGHFGAIVTVRVVRAICEVIGRR